jgi:hypothetical protein
MEHSHFTIISLVTLTEPMELMDRSTHEHDSLHMDEHCLPELFYDDAAMLAIQLCILEAQQVFSIVHATIDDISQLLSLPTTPISSIPSDWICTNKAFL